MLSLDLPMGDSCTALIRPGNIREDAILHFHLATTRQDASSLEYPAILPLDAIHLADLARILLDASRHLAQHLASFLAQQHLPAGAQAVVYEPSVDLSLPVFLNPLFFSPLTMHNNN